MSSLYEIHINVALDAPEDEIKWLWFCKENKIKTIRGINSCGVHPVHNMTSKFCYRESHEEAIASANEQAKKIAEHFRVVRVKVEGMMTNSEFAGVNLAGNDPSTYWEFHFKVAISGLADYEKLLKWVEEQKSSIKNGTFGGSRPYAQSLGVSISERGETQYPIVTIRLYKGTREEAIGFKNEVVKSLKAADFHIHDKLQAECSIYDTFPLLDEKWLEM